MLELATVKAIGKDKYGTLTQSGLLEQINKFSKANSVIEVEDDGDVFLVHFTGSDRWYEVTADGQVNEYVEEEVQNVPEGWVVTKKNNENNEWYAYMDNNGNISKVNEPKLAAGMKAIKYQKGTDSNDDTYNTLIRGSRWANAMTKDGSMWVWIPRYAYKITSGYHMSTDEIKENYGETKEAGTIDIIFLDDQNCKGVPPCP